MENYFEKATVRKIISEPETAKYEKNLILFLNNRAAEGIDDNIRKGTIECFEHKNAKFEENKEYLVKLRLLDYNIEKINSKEKKAIYIKHTPTSVNLYDIYGQIIDKVKNEVVVDCGFYVFISDNKLKKGEWVKANGRLDVFLANQSNNNGGKNEV
ncbi:Uncharacterised protein [uncultured archaeon]|nr:Uncharacterised protein [uncultured archaeon]